MVNVHHHAEFWGDQAKMVNGRHFDKKNKITISQE